MSGNWQTNRTRALRMLFLLILMVFLLAPAMLRDTDISMLSEDSTSENTTSQNETYKNETCKNETYKNETYKNEAPENDSVEAIAPIVQFYREALSDSVRARITGVSYPDADTSAQISYDDLALIHVMHYNFDGEVEEGELICNTAIADDLLEIFEELFENQYPIERIRLIDEYDADDEASMTDNNSSCFNYRVIAGTNRLSNHSFGMAVDINPLYNPYVARRNGKTIISPAAGSAYADRSADFDHKIDENDLCYRLFTEHGFSWGGSWKNSKDYQHFEKKTDRQ